MLRGIDQTLNVSLEKTFERLYSVDKGIEDNDLGLYIIRGEMITVIGRKTLT